MRLRTGIRAWPLQAAFCIACCGTPLLAQPPGAFSPPPPESMRRALTGFPSVDSRALDEHAVVVDAFYDRARRHYIWRLASAPAPGTRLKGLFQERGGRVLHSAALQIRSLPAADHGAVAEAALGAPPDAVLEATDRIELVDDPLPP